MEPSTLWLRFVHNRQYNWNLRRSGFDAASWVSVVAMDLLRKCIENNGSRMDPIGTLPQKALAVVSSPKNLLPTVAKASDVVEGVRAVDSRWACHNSSTIPCSVPWEQTPPPARWRRGSAVEACPTPLTHVADTASTVAPDSTTAETTAPPGADNRAAEPGAVSNRQSVNDVRVAGLFGRQPESSCPAYYCERVRAALELILAESGRQVGKLGTRMPELRCDSRSTPMDHRVPPDDLRNF